MRKIIHLSDLHVGYEDCGKHLQELVSTIIGNYTPPDEYVVVITGDIVDNANKEGAYGTALGILKPLISSGYRVLIVPGNHDYGTGGLGAKKFVKLFKTAFFNNENVTYPKVDVIDEIVFIGLDSMAATFNWLDFIGADGQLGRKQRQALETILSSKEFEQKKKVVYLHHHPFDGKGRSHMLKDYRQFKKIVEKKIDCLLFGHNHDGNQYPDAWGIPYCYDASSSTGKSAPRKPATPIRIIDLLT